MKELKEPEITLFGRKIVLPENEEVVTAGEESSEKINNGSGGGGDGVSCLEVSDGGEGEGEKDDGDDDDDDDDDDAIEEQVAESCETKPQEKDQNPDESKHPNSSSELDKNPKTPPIDEDGTSTKSESEPMNGPQKTILKKPDKILPCPRCNSMDTKFCYYNNYNINQPRHFCKSCQRYWTAGGTMRNVPVGAGRRKNKNSGPNCRHITISEALQSKSPSFKPNGTVLSFGPDSPLCESVASALSLTDKRTQNGVRNGYHKNGENIDDGSMTSAVMTQNAEPGGEIGPNQPVIHNINGFPFPVPFIPGIAPWNFPVAVPAILPFYPGPYWNYSLPNTWNFPWPTAQSSPTNQISTTGSDPTSPLGKHSRNGELLKTKCFENKETLELKNSVKSSVVVPKTLRIDDPEEAAKSSIWETLGIKYNSVSREGLFKALQPKDSEGKLKISASPVLQANPAALSRSISFQEGA